MTAQHMDRRDFLLGLSALSFPGLGGCAGLDLKIPRLPSQSQAFEAEVNRVRSEIRGSTIDNSVARIEKGIKMREISELTVFITAIGRECMHDPKPEHYIVTLKYLADRAQAEGDPRLSKIWLDAVGREETGRFVADKAVADAGGFSLLIEYAGNRPEEGKLLANKVAQGLENDAVERLMTWKVYKIDPRPSVADAMRARIRGVTGI